MTVLPVLLTSHGPSLRFENEKQQSQFELGVASAVFLWDDLATAVANNWGGPESAAKREWLAAAVVDLFNENEVATEDIEYRLLAAMEDEFDVTLETGTAMAVAHQIVNVYQECANFKYDLAQELFRRYQSKAPPQLVTVHDENESDDGENEHSDIVNDFVDHGNMDVDEPRSLVDEDGFTTVQRKRR